MEIELSDRDIERVAKKIHEKTMYSEYTKAYMKQVEENAKTAAQRITAVHSKGELNAVIKDTLMNKRVDLGKDVASAIIESMGKEELETYIKSAIRAHLLHNLHVEI